MLICPVCRQPLSGERPSMHCPNGHMFDIAREGYVNLLRAGKSGDLIGDDKLAARSRRDFLNKGYYSLLKDALCDHVRERSGAVVDICCGEGYYTSALGENPALSVCGFDISREMVRLAAKRGKATYFVANLASIPLMEHSMDYAIHLFAPFQEASFHRILKEGGRLLTVVPGKRHLFGLKQVLYDTPYENDESLPQTESLRLVSVNRVERTIVLESQEDIQAVFRMTPYFFHTSPKDKQKLLSLDRLETEISFVLAEYEK